MPIEVTAVFEAPWFEGASPWPWPIAQNMSFSLIRAWGGMTREEVGSAIAVLSSHGQLEDEARVDPLEWILQGEELSLPGGLSVSQGDRVVLPGCCSGVEEWTEWSRCLKERTSPWMGHDPAPWLEYREEGVRVWSDGGLEGVGVGEAPWCIETTRTELDFALRHLENDIEGFISRIRDWVRAGNLNSNEEVVSRVAEMLGFGARGAALK